jgi:F420H(2)-dependent quinone reductase
MPLIGDYEPSSYPPVSDQVDLYLSTGGAEGNTLEGKPVVILTTVGAKSGKLRRTPLMRVEHEGSYAIVASLGGAPTHPAWYYNVLVHPHVELQDGPTPRDMVAREVEGAEKAIWWERAVKAWPDYDQYQKNTDRIIPVFVLEPTAS